MGLIARFEQPDPACDVVFVIQQRLLDRFPNIRERSKVQNSVEVVGVEGFKNDL